MVITGLLHLERDSTYLQFIIFMAMILSARLLEGASAASANPASLAYIAVVTSGNDKLRSRISGLFELATLLGSIIGLVVGGYLWDRLGQHAFLVNIAFYLTSAVFFYTVSELKQKHTGQAEGHDVKAYVKLVRSPRLRELIPAWLAVSAWLGVLLNHSVFQLSSAKPVGISEAGERAIVTFPGQTLSHAFSGSQVGQVFGIYAVAFCIGILLWSLVIHRMRKSTAMLISGCGIIATSIIIGLINHTGPIQESSPLRFLFVGLMIIAVIVESGFTPAALIYLSDLSELHPENRGMVTGLYSFLLGFGQLTGTIVAGPFADWRGVDGLLIIMGILGLLSIVGVYLLRRDEQYTHQGLTASAAEAAPS
jgi:MFS family permease